MDGLCFVAVEADGSDVGFDVLRRRARVIGWGREGCEERWCCFVDRDVGGLCAQDGRDEEFVRGGVVEFAVCVWEGFFERFGELGCAVLLGRGDLWEREGEVGVG